MGLGLGLGLALGLGVLGWLGWYFVKERRKVIKQRLKEREEREFQMRDLSRSATLVGSGMGDW